MMSEEVSIRWVQCSKRSRNKPQRSGSINKKKEKWTHVIRKIKKSDVPMAWLHVQLEKLSKTNSGGAAVVADIYDR